MQQIVYRFSRPVELAGNLRLAKSAGQQLLNQEFFSLSGFRFAREIPLLDLFLTSSNSSRRRFSTIFGKSRGIFLFDKLA